MEDLKGYLYVKEQVLEIYKGEKLVKEHILHGDEDWFGVKVSKDVELDMNYIKDSEGVKVGIYDTYVEKGHTVTNEFQGVLDLQIIP